MSSPFPVRFGYVLEVRETVKQNLVSPVHVGSSPPLGLVVKASTSRFDSHFFHRLAGLVVKASASRAEDPGFESRLRRNFSGWSHTSDLKIDTPVATHTRRLAF